MVSSLCCYHLVLANPMQFWLTCLSPPLMLPDRRNSPPLFFCTFSKCPDWFMLFIFVSTNLCKGYGMCLTLRFIGEYPGSSCILLLVPFFVRFVLNRFSKFIFVLSLSNWSVIVVFLSICRIVQLKSRSPPFFKLWYAYHQWYVTKFVVVCRTISKKICRPFW